MNNDTAENSAVAGKSKHHCAERRETHKKEKEREREMDRKLKRQRQVDKDAVETINTTRKKWKQRRGRREWRRQLEWFLRDPNCFKTLGPYFHDNKDFILAALQEERIYYNSIIRNVSERLRDDKEVVMAAVQHDGYALTHASARLQADKDIVLAAVQRKGILGCPFVATALRNDRDVVLRAVQHHGTMLPYASKRLQADREIVLAAVQNDGYALSKVYLTAFRNRDAREIVLTAVQQDGHALRFALKPLQDDKEIVLAAVQQQTGLMVLRLASKRLQKDREIVLAALRHEDKESVRMDDLLAVVVDAFRDDLEVMALVIHHAPDEFESTVGDNLCGRIVSVLGELGQSDDWYVANFRDKKEAPSFADGEPRGSAVRHYAEHVWKRDVREKLRLLQQMILPSSIPLEQRAHILEHTDVYREMRLANELICLAPIFEAAATKGVKWSTFVQKSRLRGQQ